MFGPVVRSVAVSRAHARGIDLDIDAVRPGWFSVQLRNTSVQLSGVSTLQIKLENVVVRLTPWLSLRAVELNAGEIALTGTAEAVSDQLRAWRAAQRGGAEPSGEQRARLPVRAQGLMLR